MKTPACLSPFLADGRGRLISVSSTSTMSTTSSKDPSLLEEFLVEEIYVITDRHDLQTWLLGTHWRSTTLPIRD